MPIKIFIDQGHNPVNPNAGSEGNGYREQDITYRIGVDLAALLNANPQFSARLSRQNSTEVLGTTNTTSLSARTMQQMLGEPIILSVCTPMPPLLLKQPARKLLSIQQ